MAKPIADTWYEQHKIGDGVTLIRETHVADWLRCNIWHVAGRDHDLIIDTGMGLRPIAGEVSRLRERQVTAVVTHTHFDHAGGLHQFECRCGHEAEAEIISRPTDANTAADIGYLRAETFTALPWEGFCHTDFKVRSAPLTRLLDEGDVLDLGDRSFQIFHLPGHSPGSIALYEIETQILFSGDVVYDGSLLDTIYHSDKEVYRESLSRLRELPVSVVHGGHYGSFGRDRMVELIDRYLAGHDRIGESSEWVDAMVVKQEG